MAEDPQKKNEIIIPVPTNIQALKELAENPTSVGFIEFFTGVAATAASNRSKLILSAGHLAQAALGGKKFYDQLFEEVQEYRKLGKITDEKLNTSTGTTILVDLLKTIDSQTMDKEKFGALKEIFLRSVWEDTDEHTQMLAYEYYQVCKKLSSLDILVLKAAYEIYRKGELQAQLHSDVEWEQTIARTMKIPVQLVVQCRIECSNATQTPKAELFDARTNRPSHGLSDLGIEIGKFIGGKDPLV